VEATWTTRFLSAPAGSNGMHESPWTPEAVLRLREMWDEGLSTAEIGRRLFVTKNCVVGKAHRLGLPSRGSPIRPAGSGANPGRRHPPKAGKASLPPLPSLSVPAPAPRPPMVTRPTSVPRIIRRAAIPGRPTAATSVLIEPRKAPPKYGRVIECCWPLGEPGKAGFRFCCEPSEAGRPYCAEHCRIGYQKVRDRRDDMDSAA
jgi:GcrA cell cycle regulator